MSIHFRAFALGACAALLAAPAAAHHSFAMFDNSRSITLHGKVTKFQWTNPHGYLEIDAEAGKGKIKHYTLEMTSPNMMSRGGWTSRTIRTGDVVTAIVSPLRDGKPGGLLLQVTLPSGKVMLPGVPNAARYKVTS
ncbi:MAG: DUF6152 family protein [Candidatus Andeanibacterium colombiense]|uniref:DUF6152 family protein n=1 Tax=Candidatus Andeanibacterium colombiense TaxID=3121345 RepID=A0AAJ5X565_9SPHN|nr:MAG: DUF6152 family protein [Sphingomonadaceae bacterium]